MFNLMRIASYSAALFCIFALAAAAPARSALITVDYPGAQNTYALGINPEGDIVGAYDDALGQHAFILRNGEYTTFDWPGALWTNANGINPQGDIVGQYGWYDLATESFTTQGFLMQKGVLYPVAVPGQQNTMPFKINPDGMIVGCNHHNVTNQGGTDLNTMMGFSMYQSGPAEQTMAPSMNLGLHYHPAGARVEQALRDRNSFLAGSRHFATRDRHSKLLQDSLGLVLMNFHMIPIRPG